VLRCETAGGAGVHHNVGHKSCRRKAKGSLHFRHLFPILFLISLGAPAIWAVDPMTRISQYAHSVWRVQDGVLSAPPNVIAQTKDGYIWVGTETGLLRFDGARFVQWTPTHWEELTKPEVYSLLAARDGALWIGTPTQLAVWKDGQLKIIPGSVGRINTLAEDHEGRIWFTASRRPDHSPLCEVSNSAFRCHGSSDGIPFSTAAGLAVASNGELVVASAVQVIHWSPDRGLVSSQMFDNLLGFQGLHGIDVLEAEADGAVLVGVGFSGTGMGLQRISDSKVMPYAAPGLDGSSLTTMAVLTDHRNGLWIGTLADGIYRSTSLGVEHFESRDGLSGDSVRDVREDREGNLWVATDAGLDCFRDLKIVSWSTHEGLSAGLVSSVLAARDSSILIGSHSVLSILRNGQVTTIGKAQGLPEDAVTAMLEDHLGRYWMGVGKELAIYDGGKFKLLRRSDGQPAGVVVALAESTDGSIWASVVSTSRELLQIKDGRVASASPVSTDSLAPDRNGGIWLAGRNGGLGHYENGHVEWVGSKLKQIPNDIATGDDGSVLATSAEGVYGFKAGTTRHLGVENGLPCERANGLIFTDQRALLIRTSCGLIEIDHDALGAWWADSKSRVTFNLFDNLDGARASGTSFHPKVSRAPDGRIWFASEGGIQMFDPNHVARNRVIPPVHIEEMVADRTSYESTNGLSLPPLTRDIEIRYTALSFVAPQKVRFRYRLEGRDLDWQDPGSRRSAFYQDLRPGTYRFRVMACNDDGLWNDVGDSIEFRVKPAWFQTVWFRASWITSACLLIWVLYWLRVRYIAQAIGARFDERLAERTRLARELHDTFLQTVQGSKMVADDALDADADETRMRKALEKLSRWLGQAVDEGRAALHSLRVSTTEKNHLSEALQRATEDHQLPSSMTVTFSVIGDAVDLHPVVRDDVYRIAFEAIRNAAVHSHASLLEIDLRYGDTLSVRVKDNGIGIDPSISDHGKAGHFGLLGMRERAARIQSKLTIVSSTNAGTEVALVVPGKMVYRKARPTLLQRAKAAVVRLFGNSNLQDK
jgi:signal transduction histidine kinase/ligand-binding sensor domain-containing protein